MNLCTLFGDLGVGARRKEKWGKEMGAGRKFSCGEEKRTSLVHFRRVLSWWLGTFWWCEEKTFAEDKRGH